MEEYNVDRDNVVIVGHSFGGGNAAILANCLTNYFSKAVICSGYFEGKLLSIPTQWYVGMMKVDGNGKRTGGESQSAADCAESVANLIAGKAANYEKNMLCRLNYSTHGTPIKAYNKDDGEFGRNS